MRVAVLATGGKDSTLALYRVLERGYDVECLVSMFPLRENSWMFHYPNIRLVELFAEAVRIPIVKAETSGVKDVEVEDLKRTVRRLKVDGLVSGVIASNYQKRKLEEICNELEIKCITPLWQENPIKLLGEMLKLKFKAVITGVYAYGFDINWLGRIIDKEAVKALIELNKRFGVSPVGEGGEYETLVIDAPIFSRRIKIVEAERVWKGQGGYLHVKKAILEEKER
ncbi:MAG: TIGR00289 family protein [Candidatus Bathyarchaeia archaeon]